ncbi:MAG: cyclic nucleotide-binding/CBS domain-containing protein [Candidatus Binatia bacterium]
MQQPLHAQSEKEASLNRDLERLRKQLGILKSFLVAQPSGSTLVDFDLMTEEIISGVFGSSSPMVGTYDYAQIGEAAGMVNLPQDAPEGVTHATEQETLRQRQRVLEICMGDLEARRAALARGERIKTKTGPRVADYMSTTVHFIHVDATLKEVALLLRKQKIGSLLVKGVDHFIGSITETELSREVLVGGVDPSTTRVKTCMREPIISLESSDPVVEAVRLMKEKATRHLAVTDGGAIVGVISVSDILRYYSGVV